METEIIDTEDAGLWGSTVEKNFVDIMIDEVNEGNMTNGQFSSNIWKKLLENLQNKSKRRYTMKQIKQKYNRLRIKYHEFAELLQQTGFGWDRETNTVVASEKIWQNYLKAHPKESQYRKKGCNHFILLEVIFSRSTATGQFTRSSTLGPPNTDDEKEVDSEFDRIGTHNIDEDDSTSCMGSRLLDEVFKSSTKDSVASIERRVKRQRSQQMSDTIIAWTEVAKVRAEATLAKVGKYNAASEGSGNERDEFSLTKCVKILEGME